MYYREPRRPTKRDQEIIEQITHLAGVAIERKLTQDKLQRSEAFLAEAQHLSRTGSFGWNVSSGEIFWSEETYKIFEYDRAVKPTAELVLQRVHPEDRGLVQQTIDRVTNERTNFDLEHRLLMPDGSVKYLHVLGGALEPTSGDLEFVGAVTDVTERTRSEEALRQMQAHLAHLNRVSTMGELTASLAHEIKQPIGAAVTNAGACLLLLGHDQPDLGEAREAASEMIKDARRAADIVDRVRLLFQKRSSQLEVADVNQIVGEMVVMLQNEANRHLVTMRTDLAEGLPKVMADRVQLQQALMNLMLNGIEAMRDGSGVLSIKSQLGEDGHLLISVTDSGMGLPAENTGKIFDAFFTTKSQGTGLGLAITRSIIEAHGGRIWAAANLERGATFSFTLPCRLAFAA
jgi:signal transduction histidine kinase